MGPACSGLLENVGHRERVADESQVPDVEQMLQAALTTPAAAVRLRPLTLFLAQRKPKNFLCEHYLFEMFPSPTEPHLGEQMYSQSQDLQVDFMTNLGRR